MQLCINGWMKLYRRINQCVLHMPFWTNLFIVRSRNTNCMMSWKTVLLNVMELFVKQWKNIRIKHGILPSTITMHHFYILCLLGLHMHSVMDLQFALYRKCSGWIAVIWTLRNISMDHLKSRMKIIYIFWWCPLEKQEKLISEQKHFLINMLKNMKLLMQQNVDLMELIMHA